MRIAHLTPGTGSYYCGSCLRDSALVAALRRRGHDVLMVPLYMPLVREEPGPEDEQVFLGGINMYLQQKSSIFRRIPRWIARLLDSPRLLRWAAARSHITEPSALGELTLSALRGEQGRQAAELEKLVAWLASTERPDVLILSNVLLAGMARRLKERLECPVLCTLQGEAPFLDALPAPYREHAWETLAERVGDIDAFVPVSRYYGELMQARLGLEGERVHVVPNGIDLDGLMPAAGRVPPPRPTIGYLARMCRDKGLHTLVDAFITLRGDERFRHVRLRVAGTLLGADKRFVEELRARLHSRGLEGDVDFLPNIDRGQKQEFLRSISILSVPATYGESFGLYVLEALAAGVPVVQPRHGAFPEILEATGGGLLCEPDDVRSLAEALQRLLLDDEEAGRLGEQGRQVVTDRFTADRMARDLENLCMMLPQPQPSPQPEPLPEKRNDGEAPRGACFEGEGGREGPGTGLGGA